MKDAKELEYVVSTKGLKAVLELKNSMTELAINVHRAAISLKDFSRSLLLSDTLRRLRDVKRLRRKIIKTKKL